MKRNYKGLNFFSKADKKIVLTLARGEFNIYGFRSKDLAKHLIQHSKDQPKQITQRLECMDLSRKLAKVISIT